MARPAGADRAPLRWLVDPGQVELAGRWFERRGPAVILLSRFVPGTRLPTYFGAGLLRARFWTFAAYFALAVALWTPLLVGASALVGARLLGWLELADRWALPVLVLLALAILVVLRLLVPLFTWRGRRLLLARWLRLRRWEYWPPWLFYAPVFVQVVLLGLRHRSPWLFTAANPAIEAGGFIGESKASILEGLAGSPSRVARFTLLPASVGDRRETAAARFLDDNGIDYPVVLKPDQGQRGSGVRVVRSPEELSRYLGRADFDVLLQQYVPGVELGIFYYRYPGEARGRIFSVTRKHLPGVQGDGRRTLEQLILGDRRVLPMARHHLAANAARLSDVPAAGERVRLTELGTHCRGAIFSDGGELAGPALLEAFDRISRGYRGFWFGRYDARAPDLDAFREGRDFRVVELNGVTSEATHIYDARFGPLEAWRVLFEQWRIAFEIGRRNVARGSRPASLGELCRLLLRYRRAARTHPGS